MLNGDLDSDRIGLKRVETDGGIQTEEIHLINILGPVKVLQEVHQVHQVHQGLLHVPHQA